MIRRHRPSAAGLLGALAAFATAPAHAAPYAAPLVIEHVTVDPMTPGGAALADMTVVIRDGRIASVSPSASAPASPGMHIKGAGKWLMPGLTDMHVHLDNDRLTRLTGHGQGPADGTSSMQDIFTPFIANGVTQVFNLSSMSETVGQSIEIESGRVLGPHIALAKMIDGAKPVWPVGLTWSAATPEDGRQAVRDAAADGFGYIKVYSDLDLPTFTAIVDEARRLKLPVVGHIPERGKGLTDRFFQPGFGLVAHAEEFAQQTDTPDPAAIPAYVAMSKRNGTWLIATLTLDDRLLEEISHPESLKARPEMRSLPPLSYEETVDHNPYVARATPKMIAFIQSLVDFNRKLVPAFVAAGIPVLPGTDSGVPGLVPGFALHDELEALAKAGVDNRRVLEAATRQSAEWLGVAGDRGEVAVGKRADLLLLDADPMADVANTRKISAVILGGRYLSRADLDARMADLRRRNMTAEGVPASKVAP
jgi:imidazolonepropionase-like amidohydrolase